MRVPGLPPTRLEPGANPVYRRYHGEALVPLADLFNHKAALLPVGATLEGERPAEGDGRVAEERLRTYVRSVGSTLDVGMDTTLHNIGQRQREEEGDTEGHSEELTKTLGRRYRDEAEEEAEEGGREGEEVEEDGEEATVDEEYEEYEEGEKYEEYEEYEEGEEDEECEEGEEDEEGEEIAADEDSESLLAPEDEGGEVALLAMRNISADREVFNTYGEHGNRSLLSDYGFTLAVNPFDTALLPSAAVRQALENAIGARCLRRRLRELRHVVCWLEDLALLREGGIEFGLSGEPPTPCCFCSTSSWCPLDGCSRAAA